MRVSDAPPQLGFEHGMVDGGKVALDVEFEDVGVALRPALVAVHGGVGALAVAAGVGVVDEGAVQRRFDHVHHGVMDHPVAERGGGDQPGFAFVEGE